MLIGISLKNRNDNIKGSNKELEFNVTSNRLALLGDHEM
jgi:hypothetical protein